MALNNPTAVDSPYATTTTNTTPVNTSTTVDTGTTTTNTTPVNTSTTVDTGTTTTTNTTPVNTSTTVDTGTTTATTVVPARLSTTVDTGTTATQPIVAARINTVVDTPSSSGTAANTGVAINDGNATTAAAVTASGNPGAISYYAEGTSGVNQLAESGRYFRGANVYITLEEQKFITNNIAAQGNAEPGGETSEIQFNDAGTFGGDSGFTFNKNTNALTVSGNISGDYFIGNGSQLTGITAASSYGNANVVANLAALGTNPISTTGNVSAGNVLTSAEVIATGVVQSGTGLSTGGYLSVNGSADLHNTTVTGNLSATGNVSGNYFIGNGSQLTGISTANTGNVTFNDVNIIGTGNLNLQPSAGSSEYLNIYLTGAADIHVAYGGGGGSGNVILGTDEEANIAILQGGNVAIQAGNVAGTKTWAFDTAGNLTLPGNIIAINYANGNRVTGGITFNGEAVIGTGTSNTQSGLYLAPDPVSLTNDLYLRVRGNILDEPTHIHFDTGNNQYYNQYIGDDNKYILLANTGNVVVNTNDNAGNSAQWTFNNFGTLTLPGGSQIRPLGSNLDIIAGTGSYVNLTTSDESSSVGVDNGGGYITTAGGTWDFGTTGNLTAPGNISATGNITGGNVNTGMITLTNGATIKNTAGNAIAIGYLAGNTSQGSYATAIGFGAGGTSQGTDAIAIGSSAGSSSQGNYGVSMGYLAGQNTQGTQAVAIGLQTGGTSQGAGAVALGTYSGRTGQGISSVAIGYLAGNTTQGNNSVAMGRSAGETTQGTEAVAIGLQAGFASQGNYAVAIGKFSANSNQGTYAVAVGPNAGFENQSSNAVSIGSTAGASSQGINSVAVGVGAAYNTQGNSAVAVGNSAGYLLQGLNSVAIGDNAGFALQGPNNIAIGYQAGNSSQTGSSVAIGWQAAANVQGFQSVAIGIQAGYNSQLDSAVAIGASTGANTQGDSAVAIGRQAGQTSQGTSAVAIGRQAGQTSQGNNSIILNATGSALNQTTANTFTVAPVRNDTSNIGEVVFYNTTSKEITYGNVISVAGNITGNYILGNGSQLTGIAASYGNANVATLLAGFGSNTVSTTGNITTGNLLTGGIVSATGNITTAGNFVGNGAALTNVTVSVAGNIVGTQSNVTVVAGAYNWTFNNTGNLTLPGNTFSVNYANNTPVNAVTRFESAWTVPVGNSTQSFTVGANETYYMWVDCNIPNGILTWNATATVTNTNVPVVGAQYAWVYDGGGTPIDFTSIPNQFVGTANTIVRSSVAPSATTNRFDFGLNNTSGGNVTVRYGWIAIS